MRTHPAGGITMYLPRPNQRTLPEPFTLGPYRITPGPIGTDTNNIRYAITRAGKTIGAQISRPDLAQCRDREREAAWASQHQPKPKKPRFNNSPPLRCATCYLEKPHTQFYKRIGSRNARQPHCKQCIDHGLVATERTSR